MGDIRAGRLSERQLQILRLIYDRHSIKSVAETLGLSVEGVNYHLSNAREILGVGRSIDAARLVYGGTDEAPSDYRAHVAPPNAVSLQPAPTEEGPSETKDGFSGLRLEETVASYRPPPLSSAGFRWPFPTRGRPDNDLSVAGKLIWIVVCAILLGCLAIILLLLSTTAQDLFARLS